MEGSFPEKNWTQNLPPTVYQSDVLLPRYQIDKCVERSSRFIYIWIAYGLHTTPVSNVFEL